MNDRMKDLVDRLRALEDEIETEIRSRRQRFRYTVENRRVVFEAGLLERHRELRRTLRAFLAESGFLEAITSPFIYSLIVPLALLDTFVLVYQNVCFRVYGIPLVARSRYVVIDRHRLAYLNGMEKLNCVYCGYATGVIALAREVAARTEQYWCPIKHAGGIRSPHDRYRDFIDYGDAEGYQERREDLRHRAREE